MAASLQSLVRETLGTRVRELFRVELTDVALEYPPSLELGDLACPIAFELARTLKRNPRAIANEIVSGIGPIPGIRVLTIAGGGFINVFFDRASIPLLLLDDLTTTRAKSAKGGKVIVEHTNINPNK